MKGALRRTSECDGKHRNGMSGQLRGARANRLAEASREFPGQRGNSIAAKSSAGWNSLNAALRAEKVIDILNPGCIRAVLIKSLLCTLHSRMRFGPFKILISSSSALELCRNSTETEISCYEFILGADVSGDMGHALQICQMA